jgi:hypothetical protein
MGAPARTHVLAEISKKSGELVTALTGSTTQLLNYIKMNHEERHVMGDNQGNHEHVSEGSDLGSAKSLVLIAIQQMESRKLRYYIFRCQIWGIQSAATCSPL